MMPHDALADTSSLSQPWKCGETEILLEFASGISVMENTNYIADPAAAWAALAKKDPSYTFVGNVLGQPAAFIDPDKSPGGTALGSVTFVDGDVWIVVVGNGQLSLDDLRRVAGSMRPFDWGPTARPRPLRVVNIV